jgi:TPR repeat protein
MTQYELPTDEEIARLGRRPGFGIARKVIIGWVLVSFGVAGIAGATSVVKFFRDGGAITEEERVAEARKLLAADGFTEVELTLQDDEEGKYGFSGYRDGKLCAGQLELRMTRASSAHTSTSMCGVPETLEQAWRSCRGERPRSCRFVTEEMRTAEPPRFDEAERAATLGCDADDAGSCFALGLVLSREGHTAESAARAVAAYEKGCNGGDGASCNNLGILLEHGDGVASVDLVRACQVFERGCTLSETFACTSFGSCLKTGTGRPRDVEGAYAHYTRACASGHHVACRLAAALELEGSGTARNVDRAITSLRSLCDGTPPDARACLVLGFAFHEGNGPARDPAAALPLFERACELGDGNACRDAGVYHRDGLGGATRDRAAADARFARGCSLGDTQACRMTSS